jgi:DNA-directed RNA polymerase-3 subunit RPC5
MARKSLSPLEYPREETMVLGLTHRPAVKVEEDPVTAEYDVYLTPELQEHIYLLQYPNRPRHRPYSKAFGATPQDMRIKPKAGYMEVDVKLNTEQNFNKYMGLKWGDANRASRELHNLSGTYGPAAGLQPAKPRSMAQNRTALKDKSDRELDFENDLANFHQAEADRKIHSSQTLGGQIIRHDGEAEVGKPFYFVGAFQGDQLHLSKLTGTVQMRPHFHHLDAEEQRGRIATSRAQADAAGPGPEPVAHTLRQRQMDKEDQNTIEYKLKQALDTARQEQWIKMDYVDEEDEEAYETFEYKLKVTDVAAAPMLKSEMDNDAFLDAIATPRFESPTRRRKRQPKKNKDTIDVDEEDEADAQAGAEAGE